MDHCPEGRPVCFAVRLPVALPPVDPGGLARRSGEHSHAAGPLADVHFPALQPDISTGLDTGAAGHLNGRDLRPGLVRVDLSFRDDPRHFFVEALAWKAPPAPRKLAQSKVRFAAHHAGSCIAGKPDPVGL